MSNECASTPEGLTVSPSPEHITRRDFLKLSALGVGSVGMIPGAMDRLYPEISGTFPEFVTFPDNESGGFTIFQNFSPKSFEPRGWSIFHSDEEKLQTEVLEEIELVVKARAVNADSDEVSTCTPGSLDFLELVKKAKDESDISQVLREIGTNKSLPLKDDDYSLYIMAGVVAVSQWSDEKIDILRQIAKDNGEAGNLIFVPKEANIIMEGMKSMLMDRPDKPKEVVLSHFEVYGEKPENVDAYLDYDTNGQSMWVYNQLEVIYPDDSDEKSVDIGVPRHVYERNLDKFDKDIQGRLVLKEEALKLVSIPDGWDSDGAKMEWVIVGEEEGAMHFTRIQESGLLRRGSLRSEWFYNSPADLWVSEVEVDGDNKRLSKLGHLEAQELFIMGAICPWIFGDSYDSNREAVEYLTELPARKQPLSVLASDKNLRDFFLRLPLEKNDLTDKVISSKTDIPIPLSTVIRNGSQVIFEPIKAVDGNVFQIRKGDAIPVARIKTIEGKLVLLITEEKAGSFREGVKRVFSNNEEVQGVGLDLTAEMMSKLTITVADRHFRKNAVSRAHSSVPSLSGQDQELALRVASSYLDRTASGGVSFAMSGPSQLGNVLGVIAALTNLLSTEEQA